ncbi:hypothetical protein EWM64_g9502 [Hericium alpestre]|uniref:Glycosyl transferase family 3 domain-containing protein n=1 Tax=Hericium alpestre TaxID=135208 RepID=A0A4Y9ZJZ8_9AGAM|nr:hypothetical protein EWM64_g9502 [Hericium alpestre]
MLAAAADVLRKRALKAAIEDWDKDFVVDIVGTGGDGHNMFIVSTTAAVVAAGAGARVVKQSVHVLLRLRGPPAVARLPLHAPIRRHTHADRKAALHPRAMVLLNRWEDFVGLKTTVRFEVDACLPSTKPRSSKMSTATLDDLTDLLAGLKIEREGKATTTAMPSHSAKKKDNASSAPALKIIRAGSEVPQSSIVKLLLHTSVNVPRLCTPM